MLLLHGGERRFAPPADDDLVARGEEARCEGEANARGAPVMRTVFPSSRMVCVSLVNRVIRILGEATFHWEVGTFSLHTILEESMKNREERVAKEDPELDALVREIIDRVADKWTMLALDALGEHGACASPGSVSSWAM